MILPMKWEFTLFHSAKAKKIITKYFLGLLIGLILFLGMATAVQAQMFSVGEQGPRFNIPQTEFYAGLEPMNVTYEGSAKTQEQFAFEGPIIRLGYNSTTIDLFLGAGGNISGIDDVSYFDIGGNIDFGLRLYRSKKLSVQLPVRISSRYTNITNDRSFQVATQNQFQFGSLAAGAGARILARPAEDFRIGAGALPSYGFSFASGGFLGGSIGKVAAFGHLYFDRLFGDFGLSVGYKYDLRNYDVDEDNFDYKMNGHSIELGITF